MKTHRHRIVEIATRCWTSCVAPDKCKGDETAHGNVQTTAVCVCGAYRLEEFNGWKRVSSGWIARETKT